jgi:rubrerythrin
MRFSTWHQYFLSNQQHFDHVGWQDNRALTAEERTCITSSIRQFQRGEHSEGKHFLEFAKSMKDESYIETVKVFIKEEQDHAMVLGRFMDIHGISRLKNDWLDNVFRRLRKLAGLEGTITVLLTAEIMAIPYYKALHRATGSNLLRQICKQILIDEEMHLRFQSYTLRILYQRKTRLSTLFSRLLHNILMTGTIVMVWFYHHRVLRAGDFGFTGFARMSWQEFVRCKAMMKDEISSKPVLRKYIPLPGPTTIISYEK